MSRSDMLESVLLSAKMLMETASLFVDRRRRVDYVPRYSLGDSSARLFYSIVYSLLFGTHFRLEIRGFMAHWSLVAYDPVIALMYDVSKLDKNVDKEYFNEYKRYVELVRKKISPRKKRIIEKIPVVLDEAGIHVLIITYVLDPKDDLVTISFRQDKCGSVELALSKDYTARVISKDCYNIDDHLEKLNRILNMYLVVAKTIATIFSIFGAPKYFEPVAKDGLW